MSKTTNELDSFDEQAFLTDLLPYFANLKGQSFYEGYDSIEKTAEGKQSISFLADLDSIKTKDGLKRFNITDRLPKEIISSLNPYVKIYKVFYENSNDNKGTLVQLPFNNMKGEGYKIGENRFGGGFPGQLAVGLKEFSFDYLGTHPGEVETFIDCNLKLYFSSVEALFKPYNHKGISYSFIDLLKRPKKYYAGDQNDRLYNEKYFRIRVDVGYTKPDRQVLDQAIAGLGPSFLRGKSMTQYKEALYDEIINTKVSFFLNLKRHNLTPLFDTPSGAFELDMSFNASVESAFTSKGANILISGTTASQDKQIKDSDAAKKYEEVKDEIRAITFLGEDFLNLLEVAKVGDLFTQHGHKIYTLSRGLRTGRVDQARTGTGYSLKPISDNFESKLGKQVPQNDAKQSYFVGTKPFQDQAAENPDAIVQGHLDGKTERWGLRTTSFVNPATGETIVNPQEGDTTIDPVPTYQVLNPMLRVVLKYFTYRAAVEGFRRSIGAGSSQLRIAAYNRILKDMLSPVRNRAPIGHPAQNIKVYRTNISRSVIRQYNNRSESAAFTEIEKRKIQDEDSNSARATLADQARQSRQNRVESFRKFLQSLETGAKFGNPSSLGGTLDKQLKEYYSEVEKSVKNATSNDPKDIKIPEFAIARPKLDEGSRGSGQVDLRWCYFGDLIDTAVNILKTSYDSLNADLGLDIWNRTDGSGVHGGFHIVMGNFEFFDSNGKLNTYNLARFPIPLRNFVDFWTKKVVERQRDVYNIRSFIRDALVELVVNPMNRTRRAISTTQTYKPHYEVISLPKTTQSKIQTNKNKTGKITNASFVANITQNKNRAQEILFLGAQRDNSIGTLFTNDRRTDTKNGIYYLDIKKEGSPIYNVNFSRSDQQYLMEARAEKGLLDEVQQLSEVYNCTFTSAGNTNFKPGRFIYISDPHFGDINKFFQSIRGKQKDYAKELIYTPAYASMLLGIGGYYLVTKTRHRLKGVNARLIWQTECDCHWNSFGSSIDIEAKRTAAVAATTQGSQKVIGGTAASVPRTAAEAINRAGRAGSAGTATTATVTAAAAAAEVITRALPDPSEPETNFYSSDEQE